jgi:hypothetical protein
VKIKEEIITLTEWHAISGDRLKSLPLGTALLIHRRSPYRGVAPVDIGVFVSAATWKTIIEKLNREK